MNSEEFLNRVKELAEILVIREMSELERRKYFKSKLKPAHNRIKKEQQLKSEIDKALEEAKTYE